MVTTNILLAPSDLNAHLKNAAGMVDWISDSRNWLKPLNFNNI